MTIDLVAFGKEIKRIRQCCGFRQIDVRDMLGLSVETLRLLENGYTEPRLSTLELLSSLYKVDLIYLIQRYRSSNGLFADELIAETNKLIIERKYDELKVKLTDIAKSYELIFTGYPNRRTSIKFLNYFDNLKTLEIGHIKSKEKNIPQLEKLLLAFSINPNEMLSDKHYHYLEMQIAIILGINYYHNKDYDGAMKLYNKIMDSYALNQFHSAREQDFYCTAVLNTLRVYLAKGEYQQIITTGDTLLNKERIQFPISVISDIFMMKTIALWHLNDPLYKIVGQNLLMYENEIMQKKLLSNFTEEGIPEDVWVL